MVTDTVEVIIANYERSLQSSGLAANSKRHYLARAKHFLQFVNSSTELAALTDPSQRDAATRNYKDFLRSHNQIAPASINACMSALNHFYLFLGIGISSVEREVAARPQPKVLSHEEQGKLRQAADETRSERDRAIVQLLLTTGIRVYECANLNTSDIRCDVQTPVLSVKNRRLRRLPIDEDVYDSLTAWLDKRGRMELVRGSETALFVNVNGKRITTAGIDFAVRKIGIHAGLVVSPIMLRHTFISNLVQRGVDLFTIAELGDQRGLDSLRRYLLTTETASEGTPESLATHPQLE
jgi:integrase/recombinase XerC